MFKTIKQKFIQLIVNSLKNDKEFIKMILSNINEYELDYNLVEKNLD